MHDDQYAVAVASGGIAEQIFFFTMGSPFGHDRPHEHVFPRLSMRCSHGRPKDPSVLKPPL